MKNTAFLICLITFALSSGAQSDWYIAPRLGLNMEAFEGNDASGNLYKMGASIGVGFGKTISNKMDVDFSLQAKRRFAHYAYTKETDDLAILEGFLDQQGLLDLLGDGLFSSFEEVDGYTDYWTIDVPITLSYELNEGINVFGGLFVNYIMSLENKEEVTTHIPILEVSDLSALGIDDNILDLLPKNETENRFNESTDNINQFNYGLLGGIGYALDHWMVRLSYQHGLQKFRTDGQAVGNNYSRSVHLSLSYRIFTKPVDGKMKPRYDLDLIK